MTGTEFIARVRQIGKARGVEVRFDPRHGKGSHGRPYYGARRTTVQDRKKDLNPGTLTTMLRDLGLKRSDL